MILLLLSHQNLHQHSVSVLASLSPILILSLSLFTDYASMVRKPNNPTPQQASAAPAEKTPKPKEPEPSVPSQQQSKTPSPPPVSAVPAPAAAPAHTVSKPAVEVVTTAPLPAAAASNHAAPNIKASVPVVVEVIPAVVSPTAVPAASVPAVEKVDAPPPLSFGSFGELHSADDPSKPTKKSFIDVRLFSLFISCG